MRDQPNDEVFQMHVVQQTASVTHLDVPSHFRDENAPQHAVVLHFKTSQLDRNIFKIGHVQGPRQCSACPSGPGSQVTPEAAQDTLTLGFGTVKCVTHDQHQPLPSSLPRKMSAATRNLA